MNYYIKLENNYYEIVDGNTNKIIASFVAEVDAHNFIQSLFSTLNNPLQRQQQFINPYFQFPMVAPFAPGQTLQHNKHFPFMDRNLENGGFIDSNIRNWNDNLNQNLKYKNQEVLNSNQKFRNDENYNHTQRYYESNPHYNDSILNRNYENLNNKENNFKHDTYNSKNIDIATENRRKLQNQSEYNVSDDINKTIEEKNENQKIDKYQQAINPNLEKTASNNIKKIINNKMEEPININSNFEDNLKDIKNDFLENNSNFAKEKNFKSKNKKNEIFNFYNNKIEEEKDSIGFWDGETDINESKKSKLLFDDESLAIDTTLFGDDKIGAIIQQSKIIVNNTDDDSLGETSAYNKIKNKKLDFKNKKDFSLDLNNITLPEENFIFNSDDIPFTTETKITSNVGSGIREDFSEIQSSNTLKKEVFKIKKNSDLIDLGPVEEEDELYSTPRKDAEKDDFENFSLSKKEKKELKKIKKKEEISKKRYEKLLK
ncbi:hypothetical protein [Spiroplasma taiwanense]|uniref:Uncharacterized protein n=1 Tax=Spiroplasma taiwanense CT-1 TaxID=1276220 RepID=S5LST8_9MOLU|nr:hypothetical protein [Spiroplasma taiwanense]AGR40724.1 hypothetical protein STAIW_v1c00270 [Spiroplasma taiwanense CT-1]